MFQRKLLKYLAYLETSYENVFLIVTDLMN